MQSKHPTQDIKQQIHINLQKYLNYNTKTYKVIQNLFQNLKIVHKLKQ